MGETPCGRQVVAVLLPRCACSVVCAWPGVCLNYTLSVVSARKSSPCGVNWFGKREKVRPAREKWLDFGVFGHAGRVFSRFGQDWTVAGRVFSRGNGWRGALGEFCTGRAARWVLLGEFCTGCALWRVLLGEFCTGCALWRVLQGEFSTGWGGGWVVVSL